jgi:hypothetical protein
MTEEECRSLPILRKDGQCISMWQLSPEEVSSINITHCVCVGVLSGNTQPPIWVEGAAPAVGVEIEGGRMLQMGSVHEIGTLGVRVHLFSDEADEIEQARATTLLKRISEAIQAYASEE